MDIRFLCLFLVLQASSSVARRLDRTTADVKKQNVDVGNIDPFTKIMATSWNYVSGGVVAYHCADINVCTTYAGQVKGTGYIGYTNVDFQDGASGVTIVYAEDKVGNAGTGKIFFHLDYNYIAPFAEVDVGYTGGWENWIAVNVFFEEDHYPKGIHDLWVTFDSPAGMFIGNIASFTFYRPN